MSEPAEAKVPNLDGGYEPWWELGAVGEVHGHLGFCRNTGCRNCEGSVGRITESAWDAIAARDQRIAEFDRQLVAMHTLNQRQAETIARKDRIIATLQREVARLKAGEATP